MQIFRLFPVFGCCRKAVSHVGVTKERSSRNVSGSQREERGIDGECGKSICEPPPERCSFNRNRVWSHWTWNQKSSVWAPNPPAIWHLATLHLGGHAIALGSPLVPWNYGTRGEEKTLNTWGELFCLPNCCKGGVDKLALGKISPFPGEVGGDGGGEERERERAHTCTCETHRRI